MWLRSSDLYHVDHTVIENNAAAIRKKDPSPCHVGDLKQWLMEVLHGLQKSVTNEAVDEWRELHLCKRQRF